MKSSGAGQSVYALKQTRSRVVFAEGTVRVRLLILSHVPPLFGLPFTNLYSWKELVEGDNANFLGVNILVGNKADLDAKVKEEFYNPLVGEGKFFSSYVQTIATEGDGLDNLLEEIVKTGSKLLESS